MKEPKSADELSDLLAMLLQDMKQSKPKERGELARRYAIAITELEKVYAYFYVYVRDYIE